MSTRNEILELLSNGKITVEEAARLLSETKAEKTAESTPPPAPEPPPTPEPSAAPTGQAPTWFKVRVRDTNTGKNKVTVNIPLRMLKFGLKIGGRFSPELNGLDFNEIQNMVTDMQSGMLVEVQDEEDGEHVQVYLE